MQTGKVLIFLLLVFSQSFGYNLTELYENADSSGILKVRLDLREVISRGTRLRMGGAAAGVVWGKKENEATLGYYWTGKRGRRDILNLDEIAVPNNFPFPGTDLNIQFFSAGFWWTLHNSRRWKISIPLEAGFGYSNYSCCDVPETIDTDIKYRQSIYPLQGAFYAEWKATRWAGIGLQLGYRKYLTERQPALMKELDGVFFRFRVPVYLTAFYEWRNYLFRNQKLPSPFY